MRYVLLTICLLGVAEAKCPKFSPDEFRDILNNDHRKIVYGEKEYRIKNRKPVKHGIESTKLPKVYIRYHKETCKYTRMIGKKWFGSFELKHERKKDKKHKKHKKVIIID